MRVVLPSLLLLTVGAFAQETKSENLYPLEIGNTWTFKVSGQEERLVTKVAALEKAGEYECLRLDAYLKDKVVGTEHLLVGQNGVFRVRTDKDDVTPPLCILQFPAKAGDTWAGNYKLGDKMATANFKVSTDSITVPAGKFETTTVQAELTETGGRVKLTLWFAPNVGVVKQTLEEGKRTLTLELEKFEKAKK